jgi:Spy/CpxP family protein refolding chaperone
MKSKWIVLLAVLAGLLVAMAVFAADAVKKQAPPDVPRKVVHVEVKTGDGPGDDAHGDMVWDGDDDSGSMELGDDDSGGDGERRIVIRRRMGPMGGMGGGAGMWGGNCGMGHGMGHGMGAGMGPGMRMAHMFAMLDLSDAQREKLKDLHERQARRDIQGRADMQIGRLDMRKLLTADKPDAAAINAQVDRLAKMGAEMKKAHIGTFLEARALLTPEQQKKLRDAHMGGGPMMRLHEGPEGGMKDGMHHMPGDSQ